MPRTLPTIIFLFLLFALQAQEVSVPADLRQHNLTEYNSSFFHPAFSLTRNKPNSIALWSRWQWQYPDADPSTLFVNYTHRLNARSAGSVAFFQHNTGTFLNTGGVLNYAYAISIGEGASLALGMNLFGYKQTLSDTRFQQDPQVQLPQLAVVDDFILQLAPGIMFRIDGFSFGVASENLFDYNFTTKEGQSKAAEKIYLGLASYSFPIDLFNFKETVISPMIYYKSIPNSDSQIGISSSLTTERFWAQAGYNNFYGISVGGGGRFFKHFSLGALMEFGTTSDLKGKDPTFEVLMAYSFGSPEKREQVVGIVEEDAEEIKRDEEQKRNEKLAEELAKKEAKANKLAEREQKRKQDSLDKAKKAQALANNQRFERQRKQDSINKTREAEAVAQAERIKTKRQIDSLTRVRIEESEADKKAKEAQVLANNQRLEEQRKQDSIDKARAAEALADAERIKAKRQIDSLTRIRIVEAEAAKKAEEEKAAEEATAVRETPTVTPQDGEKYEEVNTEDGLAPGFYLITNVFGTKKYFDAFMKDLTNRGLEPKSFLRSLNNYNYVYLKRYDTMAEARAARDSKYQGRYQDKTWIFRVVNE